MDRVQYTHACGLVHQDLKPENFAVGPMGKDFIVFLLDYGTAYLLRGKIIIKTTANGKSTFDRNANPAVERASIVGTLTFMSVAAMVGQSKFKLKKTDVGKKIVVFSSESICGFAVAGIYVDVHEIWESPLE